MTYSVEVEFEKFFAWFRTTPEWVRMVNTREGSPWHREENVGVHTRMLIDHYFKEYAGIRHHYMQRLSLLACLFHDVGKPPSKIEKESAERGKYFAFHGHELASANILRQMAYSIEYRPIFEEFLRFDITYPQTYEQVIEFLALMVEYHLPFELKNASKIAGLRRTLDVILHGQQIWIDFISCDQHGRISDDQEAKLERFYTWRNSW